MNRRAQEPDEGGGQVFVTAFDSYASSATADADEDKPKSAPKREKTFYPDVEVFDNSRNENRRTNMDAILPKMSHTASDQHHHHGGESAETGLAK